MWKGQYNHYNLKTSEHIYTIDNISGSVIYKTATNRCSSQVDMNSKTRICLNVNQILQ